jgi:putative aldouronate transport system permease protein
MGGDEQMPQAGKLTAGSKFANVMIYALLGLYMVTVITPLWMIFVISTSTYPAYVTSPFHLMPTSFTIESYLYILNNAKGIIRSLSVTTQVVILGTILSMLLTVAGAYPLSKKDLPGRKMIFRIILFTMFFSGGLVPFYILVMKMKMSNSILAMTVPMAISTFNMIIMKNYFVSIPESLEESAKIDGYNEIQILFKIIIPVSKPVIAAIALFYGVGYWGDYFMGLLFVTTNKMYPFQVVLRQMIVQNFVLARIGINTSNMNQEQFKMACIIVGIIPVLAVYPFLQRYFVSGIMLGAIKG